MTNGPVNSGDLFLFYGLLKRGASGMPGHIPLETGGAFLGDARFRGTLLDLGGYPGVIEGETLCYGMLYRLDDASLAAPLDTFEDVQPDNEAASLYRRERMDVLSDDGEATGEAAWIYIYNQSTAGFPILEDGNWPLERGRNRV